MFCRNCGEMLTENETVCTSCGYAVGTGERFCESCGADVHAFAVACDVCGSSISHSLPKKKQESAQAAYAVQEMPRTVAAAEEPIAAIQPAPFCAPQALYQNAVPAPYRVNGKKKSIRKAWKLTIPLGIVGAHDFYLRRTSYGLIYLTAFLLVLLFGFRAYPIWLLCAYFLLQAASISEMLIIEHFNKKRKKKYKHKS